MQTLILYWLLLGTTFSTVGSLVLPQEMTAQNIEKVHTQLSKMDPAEQKNAYQDLAALPDSPMVRFAKNYLMMLMGAVFEGQRAEADLWETVTDYHGRSNSASKTTAAYLLLSIARGQISRQQFRSAETTLNKTIVEMRKLQDEVGLARALWTYSTVLVSHSHHPWDALDTINELIVISDQRKFAHYKGEAKILLRKWRRRMNQLDDYFGRASSRLQYFEASLGVPKDADLIAQKEGVLLMSGDTDDQVPSSPFVFTTFDGLFLRALMLPDDTLGLRGSVVVSDGSIWAATNRGLFHFDGKGFTQFVNTALADEENNGLRQALAQKPSWTRKHVELPSNILNELKQSQKGRLYVASNVGLFAYDPESNAVERIAIDNAAVPTKLERVAPLQQGGFVVAWEGGYATQSGEDGAWVARKFNFETADGLFSGSVYGLLQDQLGYPWVHGVGGAHKLHKGEIERVVDDHFHAIAKNIHHVLYTSDGVYWFATVSGICRQSGSHCAVLDAKRWLPAEWALDLLEWPSNHVWSSFYLGGLAHLMPPHYRHFDMHDGLAQPINMELLVLGDLFYLVNNRGLTRLDPGSGQIDNFISGVEGIPAPLGLVGRNLVLQSDEMVLMAQNIGQRKELVIFDGTSGVRLGLKHGMPDEPIQDFCEQQPGVLLFATDAAVYSLDMLSTALKRETIYDSIASEIIERVVCAPERPVWLLTSKKKLYQVEDENIVELTPQRIGLVGSPRDLLLPSQSGFVRDR